MAKKLKPIEDCFNSLLDLNKKVILSCDRAPSDLEGFDDRIKSRLSWGLVADILPASYDLRYAILKKKSEELVKKNNNQKNKKKESSVDKDKNLKNEVVQKNAKDLKETKSSKSNKIKEAETKLEKKEISSKAKKTEEPKNINHIGAPVKDLESKKENTKKTKIKAGWWNKD